MRKYEQICILPHPFASYWFTKARMYPIDRFKEGRMHDIHFRICLIKETFATEWVGEFRFENDGNEIFVTKSVFCIVNNDLTEMIDECKSVFKLLKFLSPFH